MKKVPSLLVDGMLGSLARKLRLYGIDTLYYSDKDDHELVNIAADEGRVLISSDKALVSFARLKGVDAFEVFGKDDINRLTEVFFHLGYLPDLNPERSRCPVCNGEIRQVEREKLSSKLSASLLSRYCKFFTCEACGKIYWEGGHWKKLSSLHKEVKKRIGDVGFV